MATTSQYITRKEYIPVSETASTHRTNTNPRYKHYCQVNFTAGDEEQFFDHITKNNGKRKKIELTANIWKNNILSTTDYLKSNPTSVTQNFRYLFHTLKKAIFIKIKDNKLEVFLPFSKHNFDNGWSQNLSQRFGDVLNVVRDSQVNAGRTFSAKRVNRTISQWNGNHFNIRNEYPVIEGDSNVSCLKHMFETLCQTRKLPDTEFFVNRRDFPLMRHDKKHPYTILSKNTVKNYPDTPLPILSMCEHDDYRDEAVPTWDDWCRIAFQNHQIKFCTSYVNRLTREYPDITPVDFNTKINKAVFRGSTTGHGIDAETNIRIKLTTIDDDRLDVGITSLNLRPRAYNDGNSFKLHTMSQETIDSINIVPSMDSETQSGYKYIIHLPGHSCAFRLSLELSYNSVILLVNAPYRLWFFKYLEEGTHYLSINSDLSNLSEVLDWCEANQDKCSQIASNARQFYETYLSEDSVLDFLQKKLVECKKKTGYFKYNVVTSQHICANLHKRTSVEHYNANNEMKWQELWKSKHTKIDVESQKEIIRKTSSKIFEFNHETFVGQIIKQSTMKAHFPTFRGIHENYSYWDYEQGITLFDYLKRGSCELQILQGIIIQLCGILQVCQDEFKFIHNDLYPWNIMLVPTENRSRIYYTKFGVWRTNCPYMVKILDLGKSHIVYENLHYGVIRPFENSTIRDIVVMILSISDVMLTRHCERYELSFIFDMINFLQKEPEYCGDIHNTRELRHFVTTQKRYTQVIYSDKGILETLCPGDFLMHLDVRIEDKRLQTNNRKQNPLYLYEDIFEDPEVILATLACIHDFDDDENKATFLKYSELITRENLKKSKLVIYKQILQHF